MKYINLLVVSKYQAQSMCVHVRACMHLKKSAQTGHKVLQTFQVPVFRDIFLHCGYYYLFIYLIFDNSTCRLICSTMSKSLLCLGEEGDVYPCSNERHIAVFYQQCRNELVSQDFVFEFNRTMDNYGVTPELCRYFFLSVYKVK